MRALAMRPRAPQRHSAPGEPPQACAGAFRSQPWPQFAVQPLSSPPRCSPPRAYHEALQHSPSQWPGTLAPPLQATSCRTASLRQTSSASRPLSLSRPRSPAPAWCLRTPPPASQRPRRRACEQGRTLFNCSARCACSPRFLCSHPCAALTAERTAAAGPQHDCQREHMQISAVHGAAQNLSAAAHRTSLVQSRLGRFNLLGLWAARGNKLRVLCGLCMLYGWHGLSLRPACLSFRVAPPTSPPTHPPSLPTPAPATGSAWRSPTQT